MPPSDPNVSDDSNDAICVDHQYDADTPPSIAIVRAIAALENVELTDFPARLGIRLYDHVDPTALDRLVDVGDGAGVTVELTLDGSHEYVVRICDSGRLVVRKIV